MTDLILLRRYILSSYYIKSQQEVATFAAFIGISYQVITSNHSHNNVIWFRIYGISYQVITSNHSTTPNLFLR